MKNQKHADLARHSKLAFRRMRPGAGLIRRFHALPENVRGDIRLAQIYSWLLVPFSLWPIDAIGLADHLIRVFESGRKPDPKTNALIELLGEPPSIKTCDAISAHEHNVKGGNYESLIKAQHKFDLKEEVLQQNPEFLRDWMWIKEHFKIRTYQRNGVIRRRMVSERSFRPPEWDFRWKDKDDYFRNIFDAFCHKWVLYGMEKDKPLLQKLSVNVSPYGTMIFIPRYWSFDSNRDLGWSVITRLHFARGVPKQGPKLGANQKERRKQAEVARKHWTDATTRGLRGKKRDDWVIAKLGMHPDTDSKQLRRLLKVGGNHPVVLRAQNRPRIEPR